jgi:hypothetical protein
MASSRQRRRPRTAAAADRSSISMLRDMSTLRFWVAPSGPNRMPHVVGEGVHDLLGEEQSDLDAALESQLGLR